MTKSSKRNIIIALCLVVLTEYLFSLNFVRDEYISAFIFTLKNAVFIGIIAVWSASVKNRMLPSNARKYIISAARLMIFGMMLVVIRHRLIGSEDWLARMSWYGYYTVFIFVPLLFFLSSIYFGKRENYRPTEKWKLLFIPAGLLLVGVLTNDLHYLAFKFSNDGNEYSYNWLYYIVCKSACRRAFRLGC